MGGEGMFISFRKLYSFFMFIYIFSVKYYLQILNVKCVILSVLLLCGNVFLGSLLCLTLYTRIKLLITYLNLHS